VVVRLRNVKKKKRVSSFDNKYLKGSWGRQTEVLYTHYKYNFSLVKQRNECVSNLVVLGKSFELRQCVDIIFFYVCCPSLAVFSQLLWASVAPPFNPYVGSPLNHNGGSLIECAASLFVCVIFSSSTVAIQIDRKPEIRNISALLSQSFVMLCLSLASLHII